MHAKNEILHRRSVFAIPDFYCTVKSGFVLLVDRDPSLDFTRFIFKVSLLATFKDHEVPSIRFDCFRFTRSEISAIHCASLVLELWHRPRRLRSWVSRNARGRGRKA